MSQPDESGVPPPAAGDTSWKRPLRTLLSAAMIVMLLAVSVALVGYDYVRARNAAYDDAADAMRVFSERLVDRIGVLSGDTVTLVGLLSTIPNAFGVPPPERVDDKVAFLREGLARSPHLDGVYAGYPDGSFFHMVDLDNPAWRKALDAPAAARDAVRMIVPDGNGGRRNRVMFLDAAGNMLAERETGAATYDPRRRPWYQAARNEADPISVGPYEMATSGALGMTVAEALSSKPDVVIGADVVLDTLTGFLAAERMTGDTAAFIVDQAGTPIIHSDKALMRRMLAARNERDAGASAVGDPLLRAIRATGMPVGAPFFVDADGRDFLVAVAPIDSALMFNGHRVVVAAPLDELMADANRALLQRLAISSLVVALGILCVVIMARLITRSLHQLTTSARRLQDLDFTTPIEVPSRVTEISTLGGAMNRARDAIFTFALYVPRELVRKGIAAGHFGGRAAWRQEVTALFTDIYDFTTISEQNAPEDVVTMLADYFDIFSEVVDSHDGTIIQFLGDSVFAMWNAPLADPRHAEHACLAALEVERRLCDFNRAQAARGQPEFRTRYGIHSGAAVVGSVGARERLQYTAMGDTVNVASRLEGMNKAFGTTILASRAVYEACGDAIRFRPLGDAHAKGRAQALEVFEVIGPGEATAPLIPGLTATAGEPQPS